MNENWLTNAMKRGDANQIPEHIGSQRSRAVVFGETGLPSASDAHYRQLLSQCQDDAAATQASSERVYDLRRQLAAAKDRLRELKAPPAHGGWDAPDHDFQVRKAKGQISDLEAELSRAEDAHEERRDRSQSQGHLIGNIDDYLHRFIKQTAAFDGKQPALKKGESVFEAVERCRERESHIRGLIEDVENAPILSSTLKALARTQIDALAARGRPDIMPLVETGGQIRWPARTLSIMAASTKPELVQTVVSGHTTDVLAVVAYVFRDTLLQRLEGEVDLLADDENALDDETRASRLAALREQLLEAERDEEHFIRASRGVIQRRGDADPRAVLELIGPPPRPE